MYASKITLNHRKHTESRYDLRNIAAQQNKNPTLTIHGDTRQTAVDRFTIL